MSFEFVEQLDDYEWPVRIKRPNKGTFLISEVKFNFHYRSPEDLAAHKKETQKLDAIESDKAYADFVLKDWSEKSGLIDGNGQPMPFTKVVKAKMISTGFMRTAIIIAHLEMLEGVIEKN